LTETNLPRKLPRLISDFAVIVIGVFVAVAAESWWSERENRSYERELREDMVAEFASNVQILESDISQNSEARKHIGFLAGLSNEDLEALSDNRLSEHLIPTLNWAGFDPEMGSAQALVESGSVGAIGDRDLRLLMASWAGLLEANRRFNLQAVSFQDNVLRLEIARAGADELWSSQERQRLQILFSTMALLHVIVVNNQRRMLDTAKQIHDYLTHE
jgi:hypothetical protein